MKFFRKGISKIKFAPAVASMAAPTRAEITSSTDLSPQVAAISGFQLTNSPISVPNLAEVFTPTITGEDTVSDSSITFNDDDTVHTIRTALAKGTTGYLLMFPYGDVAAKRMEVWPVSSAGVNDEWTVDASPARFVVGFAIGGTPEQDAVVPALT